MYFVIMIIKDKDKKTTEKNMDIDSTVSTLKNPPPTVPRSPIAIETTTKICKGTQKKEKRSQDLKISPRRGARTIIITTIATET